MDMIGRALKKLVILVKIDCFQSFIQQCIQLIDENRLIATIASNQEYLKF